MTEEVWQRAGRRGAASRGIDAPCEPAAESIMIAPWPESDRPGRTREIEARSPGFRKCCAAVRDIRGRQNVPPKTPIEFSVRCDAATAELLRPMEPYFASMAGARPMAWGPEVEAPPLSANVALAGMEVFVDLAEPDRRGGGDGAEAAGNGEAGRSHRRQAKEAGEQEFCRPRPGRRGRRASGTASKDLEDQRPRSLPVLAASRRRCDNGSPVGSRHCRGEARSATYLKDGLGASIIAPRPSFAAISWQKDMSMPIPMELSRIIISELNDQQVIYLKEIGGERTFPILIGLFEATSIDRRVKGNPSPRPLTHDLIVNVVENLGAEFQDVIISELKEHTYFARLRVRHQGELVEIDARPSDAIAVAVTCNPPLPIYVNEDVLNDVLGEQRVGEGRFGSQPSALENEQRSMRTDDTRTCWQSTDPLPFSANGRASAARHQPWLGELAASAAGPARRGGRRRSR